MAYKRASAIAFNNMVKNYAQKYVHSLIKNHHAHVHEVLFRNLVLVTPVLSGQARHNWRSSTGRPIHEFIKNKPDGTNDAGIYATSQQVTPLEETRIQDIKQQIREAPVGQSSYIANSVPYIFRLESGYSDKAPAGMAKVSLHATLEVLKSGGTGS